MKLSRFLGVWGFQSFSVERHLMNWVNVVRFCSDSFVFEFLQKSVALGFSLCLLAVLCRGTSCAACLCFIGQNEFTLFLQIFVRCCAFWRRLATKPANLSSCTLPIAACHLGHAIVGSERQRGSIWLFRHASLLHPQGC